MQSENHMFDSWFVIVAVDQHKKDVWCVFLHDQWKERWDKNEKLMKKKFFIIKDWIHWFLSFEIDEESNHRVFLTRYIDYLQRYAHSGS